MAGADEEVLARCPGERLKFVAMGGTVLATSVLATVSAAFTAAQFLHAPGLVAVLIGLAWGAAIMTLDRWLIMSIRRQSTALGTLVLAAPRVALAVVAGLVIAKPIVLRMFDDEVHAQAVRDKQDAFGRGKARLDRDFRDIPRLTATASSLERTLTTVDGGQVLVQSPEYQLASKQVQELDAHASQAQQRALCELDGTCGTSHDGAGPVYARKQAVARDLAAQTSRARERLGALRERLLGMEASKRQQATGFTQRHLDQVQALLANRRTQYEKGVVQLYAEYRHPVGLLDRIDALGALSDHHASTRNASLLVSLFLLMLDAAPAVGKALMVVGKRSLYECIQEEQETRAHRAVITANRVQDEIELAEYNAVASRARAEHAAHEITAGAAVEEAKVRRQLEREVTRELLARAVAEQRRVSAAYIEQLAAALMAAVPEWVEEELDRGAEPLSHANGHAW